MIRKILACFLLLSEAAMASASLPSSSLSSSLASSLASSNDKTLFTLPPEDGGLVYSLGRPFRRIRPSLIGGLGTSFSAARGTPSLIEARFAFAWDLLNPVILPLSLVAEVGAGVRGDEGFGMVRAQAAFPIVHLAAGVAHKSGGSELSPYFTFWHPIRRGGILGAGTLLRLDYLPAHEQTLSIGIEIPIANKGNAGHSRPRQSEYQLGQAPEMPESRKEARPEWAVQSLEQAIWVYRFTTPPIDRRSGGTFLAEAEQYRQALERYRGAAGAVRTFHDSLEKALGQACGERCATSRFEGRPAILASLARKALLEKVLVPYNRLLGSLKNPDDSLGALGRAALGHFSREARLKLEFSADELVPIQQAFQKIIGIVEDVRDQADQDWGGARFVWLPLQLGLLPEEHDSREELKELVERLTRVELSSGNSVRLLSNLEFLGRFRASVEATRRYHVLWIHDFRGVTEKGKPDRAAAWAMNHVYLESLTRAVRDYDRTGKIPLYLILLDQWYYEANQGWLYLKILEDPLGADLSLPDGFQNVEADFKAAQRRLSEAVQESKLLQIERAQYGEDWLRNRIKVHVNITNPADLSFSVQEVLPVIGIPDNVMRDHRKIVFYDLDEKAPESGGAILTGMGIGEKYASASWLDRGLELQGPAALKLKDQAYRLLLGQGFSEAQIPEPLRPKGLAPLSAAPRTRSDSRIGQFHNPTGVEIKEINSLKGALYTLMPPGSVVVAPDSLWASPVWASMLAGAALSGVRSYVVVPSRENAPGGGLTQVRTRDVLTELIAFRGEFGKEISTAGGKIEAGVYSQAFKLTDLKAGTGLMIEKLEKDAVMRELLRPTPEFIRELKTLNQSLEDPQKSGKGPDEDERPRFHAKVNLIATSEAWRWITDRPEVGQVLIRGIRSLSDHLQRTRETQGFGLEFPELELTGEVASLRSASAKIPPSHADRMISYYLTGSHNQNLRSMALDGEIMLAIEGSASILGFLDMTLILSRCEWIRDQESLDRYLPESSGAKRAVGRWMELLL